MSQATPKPAQEFSLSHHDEADFRTEGLRRYSSYRDLGVALATGGLYVDSHVTSYSIGYSYGGSTPVELDTIAINGGSGLTQHIPAGSEEELNSALAGVIDRVKFCRPPPLPD